MYDVHTNIFPVSNLWLCTTWLSRYTVSFLYSRLYLRIHSQFSLHQVISPDTLSVFSTPGFISGYTLYYLYTRLYIRMHSLFPLHQVIYISGYTLCFFWTRLYIRINSLFLLHQAFTYPDVWDFKRFDLKADVKIILK